MGHHLHNFSYFSLLPTLLFNFIWVTEICALVRHCTVLYIMFCGDDTNLWKHLVYRAFVQKLKSHISP